MPNAQNITRPITLISFGRSGTSLVHNILAAHPDVDGCGETQPILFGTWEGARRVRNVIRPDKELPPTDYHSQRCAKAVQAVFLSFFHDPGTSEWVHKPINVPFTVNEKRRRTPKRFERAAKGYWEAIHTCFPDSRNITVLRHPYDVALSAQRYWGNPIENIWRSIVNMAQILDHPDATIGLAVSHERLSNTPEPEIERLLDHLGLSRHSACFDAAEKVYVAEKGVGRQPKEKMEEHTARGFSHRDRWSDLDMSSFKNEDRDILTAMWARYGEALEF